VRRLLAGAAALLILSLPAVRSVLVHLEPLVAPTLFVLALVLWAAQARARRGPAHARLWIRRLERRAARALQPWGLLAALLAFLLPLWVAWELRPTGGAAAFAALFGRIPYRDALGHFEGALRLMTEGQFTDFSARRPLNACWLSSRLALTGMSLSAALVVQALLLGLATWAAARAVAARLGLAPMLAFFALVYGLTRDYAATTVTEPLGVTLAVLGWALLVCVPTRRRLSLFALALLLIDLSLHVRPGAQFLTPALALWGLVQFRHRLRAAVLVVAVVIGANGLLTATLNRVYGGSQSSFASYPAYTLYGLAAGNNYRQAAEEFGPQLQALPNERSRARFLYARSWESVRRKPRTLLRTLARNEARFLRKLVPNLSRVVSASAFVTDPMARVLPSDVVMRRERNLGLPLLVVALGALASRWRRLPGADRGLIAAGILGLLASAPFVYGDGGFRVLATAYPLLAILFAAGLAPRRPGALTPVAAAATRGLARTAAAYAAGIVGIGLVVPSLQMARLPAPDGRLMAGLVPGRDAVVRIDGLSPAVLVWNAPPGDLQVPALNRRQFHRHLDLADAPVAVDFDLLDPPYAVVGAWDFVARAQRIFVIEPGVLRSRGVFLRLQAEPRGELLVARAWSPLGP